MKLYIKQKVRLFKDELTVKDEEGLDRYYIRGEALSVGKKLHIFNTRGDEIACLRQKFFSLLPKMFLCRGEEQLAIFRRKWTWWKPVYERKDNAGRLWLSVGSVFGYQYRVQDMNSGEEIAEIRKKMMSWGDSYEIEIHKAEHEIDAMITVIAIDAMLAIARS